jgi:DNA-binding Lrp family transcriptional regulator
MIEQPGGTLVVDRNDQELDERDYQILRELQRNARIRVVDLANRISLSPSPCFSRLKRLEDSGVIKGYTAILDYEKLGKPVVAYVNVTLGNHTRREFDQFERLVNDIPEIISCNLISGDFDYILKIVARDIDQLHSLASVMFAKANSIAKHFTFISIKEVKDRSIVPVDFFLDRV